MGSFIRKPIFKIAWKAIPKCICWKVWFARNKAIFQDEWDPPRLKITKVRGMLAKDSEIIGSKIVKFHDNKNQVWQIRKENLEFKACVGQQEKRSLFFYGAS